MDHTAVLTGVETEAACLAGHDGLRVACSGADAMAAERLAGRLVADGARALVSFGLCGGLDATARPGTLLLPDTVVLTEGDTVAVTAAWRARVARAAAAAGCRALSDGRMAESRSVVASAPDKQRLAAATGAVAVDMESGAVARVAVRHGLPFLVVRAVADPAERTIPGAALAAVRPDGRVDHAAVVRHLLAKPWQLPHLLRLARDSAAGLTTLRRTAVLIGPPPDLDETPDRPRRKDPRWP